MLSEGYEDLTGIPILTLSPLSPLLPFWPGPPVSPCGDISILMNKYVPETQAVEQIQIRGAYLRQPYRYYSEVAVQQKYLVSILSWRSRRPCNPWQPCRSWLPITPGWTERPLLSLQDKWEKLLVSLLVNTNRLYQGGESHLYITADYFIFFLLECAQAICLIMTLSKARAHIFLLPSGGKQCHSMWSGPWNKISNVHNLTGSPFSPIGPAGPTLPGRPGSPMLPADPAGPLSPVAPWKWKEMESWSDDSLVHFTKWSWLMRWSWTFITMETAPCHRLQCSV